MFCLTFCLFQYRGRVKELLLNKEFKDKCMIMIRALLTPGVAHILELPDNNLDEAKKRYTN
jgi:hypothetical protein